MTTIAELMPCPNPWCEALEREGDYSPAVRLHHHGNYRVVCTSCIFEGPCRATPAEAVAAWNTRPPAKGHGPVTIEAAALREVGEALRMARLAVTDLGCSRMTLENIDAGLAAIRNLSKHTVDEPQT